MKKHHDIHNIWEKHTVGDNLSWYVYYIHGISRPGSPTEPVHSAVLLFWRLRTLLCVRVNSWVLNSGQVLDIKKKITSNDLELIHTNGSSWDL